MASTDHATIHRSVLEAVPKEVLLPLLTHAVPPEWRRFLSPPELWANNHVARPAASGVGSWKCKESESEPESESESDSSSGAPTLLHLAIQRRCQGAILDRLLDVHPGAASAADAAGALPLTLAIEVRRRWMDG